MDALLIACSQAVVLLEGGRQRRIHEGCGIYYGITWDGERVYIASRGWPGGQAVLVFDGKLAFTGTLPTGKLWAVHQIGWFDGQLYITNTEANRLEVWDGKRSGVWDYSGANRDVDHINSVWADRLFVYVGEHRGELPSRVKVFDRRRNLVSTVENTGWELHNVYREGRYLYTLSSGQDGLLVCDLVAGSSRLVSLRKHHGGYARGLARTKGRWYVGMSARARRGERGLPGPSAILALDDRFDLVERVDLDTGQVCEIRALEGDRAHNGLSFPGR